MSNSPQSADPAVPLCWHTTPVAPGGSYGAVNRGEQMNRLSRIQGFAALLCFSVYALSFVFLRYSPLCVLWLAASLVLAVLGLRSPARYDKFCAKAVLVLVLALIGFSWFMPALGR